ncbi:hypothetical protein [Sphingobium scionense]|jgi:hypothetical protein|uniref:Uncharacterized protein n=1 Tax=Sphingobium scionense TaxID=1404341 RepID=A0A7W6LPR5_9SPHN|nr:hypothetical protein [Sphingobium scionense]MBB4148265.1 hypothetical protein [Sphingobium scionense]
MNEYLSRSEISPVDRSVVRAPVPAAAVQPVSATESATEQRDMSASDAGRRDSFAVDIAAVDEDAAGAAEYARIHAQIADILADMRTGQGALSVDGASAAVQAMMPQPFIYIPLPPATREAVEQAADLAKRIAQQASYAYAAQAHVARGTVDQILSASAI